MDIWWATDPRTGGGGGFLDIENENTDIENENTENEADFFFRSTLLNSMEYTVSL